MKKAGTAIPPSSRNTPSPACSPSRATTRRCPRRATTPSAPPAPTNSPPASPKTATFAARLLQRQQRPDLVRKVLARAIVLAPDNADYRRLSSEIE